MLKIEIVDTDNSTVMYRYQNNALSHHDETFLHGNSIITVKEHPNFEVYGFVFTPKIRQIYK